MKIVNESVQMIHLGPNTPLTFTSINYALQRARSNHMYAKFYTDKYFIQVNFMKDSTINISTNIKSPQVIYDLNRMESRGWTFSRAEEFVYRWMQTYRKTLK